MLNVQPVLITETYILIFFRNLVTLILFIDKLLGVKFKNLTKIIGYVKVCFLEVRLYKVTEILMSLVIIHKAKSLYIADYAYCR